MRIAFLGAVAALALTAPAYAVTCLPGDTAAVALATDISPTALACVGRYDKNILNAANLTLQKDALADLGVDLGPGWNNVAFTALTKVEGIPSTQHTINFGKTMYGLTYIGVHTGGKGGGSTSFYKFDAGAGMSSFTWVDTEHFPSSNAVLYRTGAGTPSVPEPASWAMMLGGFASIGGVLRSRRRPVVRFS